MVADAIITEGLSKQYLLGQSGLRQESLREAINRAATAPIRRLRHGQRAEPRDPVVLNALDDVSLRIPPGEVVGIIGNNGAGKSTLLKVLSRITEPSSGWAEMRGRVGSLLEVGTGFHPELTGRENVFLNGAVLGMRRSEIRQKFDEIVAFADVERFLDTPVKRYSSGMYVRLAFSVAAHLQTEILIVDEVLSVGDTAFQRKCLGRMDDVARQGRTVLFVSHNLAVIQALCRRGVVLERGRVAADGPIEESVALYLRGLESLADTDLLERTDRRGQNLIMASAVKVRAPDGGAPAAGGPVEFVVSLNGLQPGTTCTLTILNRLGQPVCRLESGNTGPNDDVVPVRSGNDPVDFLCRADMLPLTPGRYRLDISVRGTHHLEDEIESAALFDVEPGLLSGRPVNAGADGAFAMDHRWSVPSL